MIGGLRPFFQGGHRFLRRGRIDIDIHAHCLHRIASLLLCGRCSRWGAGCPCVSVLCCDRRPPPRARRCLFRVGCVAFLPAAPLPPSVRVSLRMRSSFPFSHPGSNGPFAGNQQTRPPPAAAAAAAASHASSWQPSALFFGGPVPSGSSHSTSMAMRSPAPMGFVLAAPLPTLPAANPMRPPPPPPRTNGFPSQISAEGEEDDSCSDSDSDGDPHSQSASNQARKQLRCKSQERGQRAPVRPVADARRSRDEFKSAPTSMHAHSQRPGGSNGASRNSSAHPPPVVASAAAAASSSSVPSAPAPPAPAAPSPFHFHRALPRIDLDQVSVPSGWTPRTADVIIIGAGAAGQQCAEMLSKLSPLRPTGAIPGSPSHSLSILMLEGRPRLGGRVFSEKWTEGGSSVVVEHGAAFIHGCDGQETAISSRSCAGPAYAT